MRTVHRIRPRRTPSRRRLVNCMRACCASTRRVRRLSRHCRSAHSLSFESMTLVRSGRPEDADLESLRQRTIELETALKERDAEITRTRSDLAAFGIRYRQDVGLLHEQLDELERAIAEAELGEMSKRLDEERDGTTTSADRRQPEPSARYTSDAVRRLFRDVAKTIHPDLARDEVTRDRRHALMVEANRAYALGDEERLRRVLDAWGSPSCTASGLRSQASRSRLVRRLAEIEEQLTVYSTELRDMQESPLWKLKAMVDAAAARDIMAARNRLDAMT